MSIFFKKIRSLNHIEEKILIEYDRHHIKYVFKNNHIPFFLRNDISSIYNKKGRRLFYGNLHFRCLFNFRSRAILSKLSLSRFGLKQLGGRGLLAGFQKASW